MVSEIERKFLPDAADIDEFERMLDGSTDPWAKKDAKHIEQVYVGQAHPDYDQKGVGIMTRFRCEGPVNEHSTTFLMTVKLRDYIQLDASPLARREIVHELTEEEFRGIIPKISGGKRHVKKTRHRYTTPLVPFLLEVDVFSDVPLIMIEVEFHTVRYSKEWRAPDFFGEEVTHDNDYLNENIAQRIADGETSVYE